MTYHFRRCDCGQFVIAKPDKGTDTIVQRDSWESWRAEREAKGDRFYPMGKERKRG